MTTPFPPAKSRLHLRVVETFGPGLRLVVDAHPLATGTRLAKSMGAELAVDLPAAVEALVARVDAAEHRRSLERVERVTRLQRKLKTYSPDTDRELIDQHADLTAALALSADAGDSMPDIERLLERMTSTRAVLAAAQDDLEVASKAVTFLPQTTAARPDAPRHHPRRASRRGDRSQRLREGPRRARTRSFASTRRFSPPTPTETTRACCPNAARMRSDGLERKPGGCCATQDSSEPARSSWRRRRLRECCR